MATGDRSRRPAFRPPRRPCGGRDEAGVVDEDGKGRYFQDLRGAFATRLMRSGLQDDDVAELMGWSTKKTESIRRTYVDQAVRVVAIRERLSAAV